jgi:hypothetical protein
VRKAALAMSGGGGSENYRPDFSSERAPHITKSVSLKIIKERRKKLVAALIWVPDTKTDWLTDRRS